MGNALRFLYGQCCKASTSEGAESSPPAPHLSLSPHAHGVSLLAHHLFHFDITSQVPDGLSKHVISSEKAQASWYRSLLEAWRGAIPPPKTAEEAARLIVETLTRTQKADVEGLLGFYGLPLPDTLVELSVEVPTTLPEGVNFELQTLPVDAKCVQDGDSLIVYVSTADPRESLNVPPQVSLAAVKRSKARTKKKYDKADVLHKKIISAGYREKLRFNIIRVLKIQDEEILARKYRIRLRGIDAPENKMPYGDEAKEELTNLVQGKCLRILVYGEDQYGRSVGDIYCNGMFVQGVLLKKGCVWHYVRYDKRPQFAKWAKEARAKRVGLWGLPNPEKPWDWRRNNPRTDSKLE